MVGIHVQGISKDDVKNVTHSGNFVAYTLSANKNYSAIFEVYTCAGSVNLFNKIFSKMNSNVFVISVRSVYSHL